MLTLFDIFGSFQIACLGFVITCVLTEQGMLLEWYHDMLCEYSCRYKNLTKVLGLCEKCFSGQLALWIWLHISYEQYLENSFIAFVNHCVFISFTILFVILIKSLFDELRNR